MRASLGNRRTVADTPLVKSLLILVAVCVLATPTILGLDTWAGPTYMVGLGIILTTLWRTASTVEPRVRSGWRWLAITATLWFAGDALDRWGQGLGETLYTYAPQACWLGSYLTMSLAILALIRRRGLSRTLRREIMQDTLVVAIASALILWRFLARPSITADMAPLDLISSLAYPSGDLMLITLWTTLVLTPGRSGLAQRLIGASLAGTVATDIAFAVLPTLGLDAIANHLDGILLIFNALLAVAAMHPSRDLIGAGTPSKDGNRSSMSGWRVAILGISLGAVTTSAAIAPGASPIDLAVTVIAGLGITAAILMRFFGLVRDRDAAESRLTFNAHHDALTGLANRTLLTARLRRAFKEPFDRAQIVVFFIDLDGFKPINDRHGHSVGDAVLCELAARMTDAVRPSDTVARLGGDEFVILCHPMPRSDAPSMALRLAEAIHIPVQTGADAHVAVHASIGIAYGADFAEASADDAPALLIDAADREMYMVKTRTRTDSTATPV